MLRPLNVPSAGHTTLPPPRSAPTAAAAPVAPRRPTATRSWISAWQMLGAALQREPDLERDLPVGDLHALDVPAGLGHLEPPQVADGLRGLRDRFSDGVFDADGGRADELDRLVDVLRHPASSRLGLLRPTFRRSRQSTRGRP